MPTAGESLCVPRRQHGGCCGSCGGLLDLGPLLGSARPAVFAQLPVPAELQGLQLSLLSFAPLAFGQASDPSTIF